MTSAPLTVDERVRSHPGWFSGVMGTAALATAAFRLPDDAGDVGTISTAFGWMFFTLAVIGFLLILCVNAVKHTPWRVIWHELRSRDRGPAYAAVPGSVLMIVLALEAGVTGLQDVPLVGWTLVGLTLVAALADLLFTLVFFSSAIANRGQIEDGALSGVWFMPQTILLLSAAAFARLTDSGSADLAAFTAPLAVMFLGAGMLLFLFIGALVLGRLVSAPLAPASGVPAAWIMMSPSAAAALALIAVPLVTPTLLELPSSSVTPVTGLLAGMLVGFSVWWLLVVVLLTVSEGRDALKFSPASWGYVFPLAAVAVASGGLAATWDSGLMIGLAVAMAILASISWIVIVVISLRWIAARRWRDAVTGK